MKKFSWILIILFSTWFVGCNKDNNNEDETPGEKTSFALNDGTIIVTNNPKVTITALNNFPTGVSTSSDFAISKSGMRLKSTNDVEPANDELRGNDYRFKLISEVSTLTIDGVEVQVTHVKIEKISDALYYAFVSYNERGNGYHGGVVIFEVTVNDGPLVDVSAKVNAIQGIEMANAELSALDFYNNRLYMTGASIEPKFGYEKNDDRAFYMILSLDGTKKFKEEDAVIKKLTSFQGTSVRVVNNRAYVTTGDGTEVLPPNGGLYIFDATSHDQIKFIGNKKHARSVDVTDNNIFLMQANGAMVTRYDLDGNSEKIIYNEPDEALQKDAKSEILAWNNYLFVAENESGLRMLDEDGDVNDQLVAPGSSQPDWNKETQVTNSVAMNSDLKKNDKGVNVTSNLLFLANGENGISWYDVMNVEGKDKIVLCNSNSALLDQGSANFVASKGNIVFVADGLGGLKILYIGFNNGDTPPPVGNACNEFLPYLIGVGNVQALLPEGRSVFRDEADPIIKKLFETPGNISGYFEILEDTEMFLSYISEFAGWHNSLGHFVIPGDVVDEVAYYNSVIRPDLCETGTNILKDKYVIFKNITDKNEGGPLTSGSTFKIGNFKKGDKVVLFIVPLGWNSQNNRVEVAFNSDWNQVFFTHTGLNKATNVTYDHTYPEAYKGIQYNTFYSADCKSIVMFFEDKSIGCDTDYNDFVFSISDNIEGNDVVRIKAPEYSIYKDENGQPQYMETSELFSK